MGVNIPLPSWLRRHDLWVLLLLILVFAGLARWAGSRQAADEAQRLRELARPGDILMISSETCVFCTRARLWLDEADVPYRECLIERDAACLAQYQARGGRGTPTFVVRGHTLLGFDRPRMLTLLGTR